MSQRKITILFGRDGSSKIEAHGFTGTSCTDATKIIEAAIGKLSAPRQEKPEMHAKAKQLVRH